LVVQRVLARAPHAAVRIVEPGWERESPSHADDPFGAGKAPHASLLGSAHFFGAPVLAGTPGLVCCNYLVVSLISNCPMDCSYCFLQEYLANNPTLKVIYQY